MSIPFPPNLNSAVDLMISDTGDLMVGPDGDLQLISGIDALGQTVMFRLKTRGGDARYIPNCGASLDTLVGLPFSQGTADKAEQLIINTLTYDGLFNTEDITVISAPVDDGKIAILLALSPSGYGGVTQDQELMTIESLLDLQEGLLV